jgi:hypothetical protein
VAAGWVPAGLAFMASAPRGQHELDFGAEEAAILTAVGQTRIDLIVEDTGDPEHLGRRLAGTQAEKIIGAEADSPGPQYLYDQVKQQLRLESDRAIAIR